MVTPDNQPLDIPARMEVVRFSAILASSYHRLLHSPLVEGFDDLERSRRLFDAPFVVVAHGTESDPLLCYGNRAALSLWEMPWEKLIGTPSRLTAEPGERAQRERLLDECRARGFTRNYRGIRISATGRRFWIEDVIVWNLMDSQHNPCGQAATFSTWKYL